MWGERRWGVGEGGMWGEGRWGGGEGGLPEQCVWEQQ